MSGRLALSLLGVLVGGALACSEPEPDGAASSEQAEASERTEQAPLVDQATLAALLGEAVEVEGERVRADGLLVRLAFEPLILQAGPARVQLVSGQGYKLLGVVEGSPLWQLGLREGDVLTTVDGEPIVGREHELRTIWGSRPSRADLGYLRGEEARVVKLRIRRGAAWQGDPARDLREEREAAREHLRRLDPLPPRGPTSGDSGAAAELVEHLRCVPDPDEPLGRCELERGALDELLANPTLLARQARVIPALKDGEAVGFKLYGIRRGSLFSLLGIQNGDLIRSVDGIDLGDAEAAMEAYAKLRDAAQIEFELDRRGRPVSLEIAFVDELSGPPSSM
jgi:S1-C subfamily serine protease